LQYIVNSIALVSHPYSCNICHILLHRTIYCHHKSNLPIHINESKQIFRLWWFDMGCNWFTDIEYIFRSWWCPIIGLQCWCFISTLTLRFQVKGKCQIWPKNEKIQISCISYLCMSETMTYVFTTLLSPVIMCRSCWIAQTGGITVCYYFKKIYKNIVQAVIVQWEDNRTTLNKFIY
jgi:hypothetical protein